MSQPPSGTVTFLFTDLEGSTRLWEDRPDEMQAALAEHDARFRSVIAANDGYLVKGRGDGFHAAFGRAADAVAAAEQCQAAIADLPDINVRMGINTGEVQERDGDYFGPPVNRAARLMAAGNAGQVLIAAVTAELVPGLVLKNLGEHRLRDLGSPMQIWQLGTAEFPPLRTLDELPGNLPVQRTTFIGRADEVKALTALVGTERLVTLTGVGGVGKSRLALQVAAEVAPEFKDGVWFASLAALEEGALTAATVLRAVGVSEREGEPPLDTLCAWAATREALVVIDNCEHLLAQVAVVVDRVLNGSATVSVLATSQAPLEVSGEHAWAVSPMSSGEGVAGDSVELFVDRARMARANFELTGENEAAVVEICERLDHVPLAIELAAARVRGMTPADIARRLDQRLRLLTSSDRLAPGRHRTLDAAVRWSYELLDETQQHVFDRLSVFAGPFTIEAAEVVVAGAGVEEWEVLDGVLALVDKSLVVADERSGDSRYRLLETMRHFGQANIAAVRQLELYRGRHTDYYAGYVSSRRAQLRGSGDLRALVEIESEIENIRVALRQTADDLTSSRFEDLFSLLYTLWSGRGRNAEGASWALELPQRPDLDPAPRIEALGYAAYVMNPRDLAVASNLAAAAEKLWESTHAALPLAAWGVMGVGAMMQGQNEAAVAHCKKALVSMAGEPDLFLRGHVLSSSYSVLAVCRDFESLDDVGRDLTALVDQLGNRYLEASSANSIATGIHLTDPDGAAEHLLHTYALDEEVGLRSPKASTAMFLALHEFRAGDDVAAAQWTKRALELAIEHGPSYIAQVLSPGVAIIRRRSLGDAAVLLGAIRAHRARKHQGGTQPEIEGEARYETSLRRALGDRFDPLYARGLALDEPELIAFAVAQLDAIVEADPRADL